MSLVPPQPSLSGDEIPQSFERGMASRLLGERVVNSLQADACDSPLDSQGFKLLTRVCDRAVDNRIDLIGHRNLSRRSIAMSAAMWAPITQSA